MAIDKMGSRFYMQQMKGIAATTNKKLKQPVRQKKDIIADIQKLTGLELKSLMNVTKQTLEDLYAAICIQKG
jgi:hypothetical protein